MSADFNGERVAALMRAEDCAQQLEQYARIMRENLKDLTAEPERLTDDMQRFLFGEAQRINAIGRELESRVLDLP